MQLYLFINGEQVGPYTAEQVQGMLASGAVAPDTMAWHEGLPEWTAVSQVVGAESAPAPAVPVEAAAPAGEAAPVARGEGEVILHVEYQENYSRGQMLLRTFFGWLYMLLPHGICLAVLQFAWNICAVIAWFSILFTGSHPEGLYNFVNLTKQWQQRVAAHFIGLVDGYPAFGLGNKGDKVHYLINRPTSFSRLHCVMRIFAPIYVMVPHGICLFFRQLIGGVLMVVAFFAVLFTGRYPRSLHEFQVGNMRWTARVVAYVMMMSDRYPPFSGKH